MAILSSFTSTYESRMCFFVDVPKKIKNRNSICLVNSCSPHTTHIRYFTTTFRKESNFSIVIRRVSSIFSNAALWDHMFYPITRKSMENESTQWHVLCNFLKIQDYKFIDIFHVFTQISYLFAPHVVRKMCVYIKEIICIL